jgi:hypothetical protein
LYGLIISSPEATAMSKPNRRLDSLHLANPCPVSWQKMTGDDRTRFCPQCQLHVYNLSAMTKQEAESFLQEKEGRTCLRFFRRADGTIMTQDCPVGRRQRRTRPALVAGLAAAALLILLAPVTSFVSKTSRHRQETTKAVTQCQPLNLGIAWLRQWEPFKTVLEWLDPTPPPPPGRCFIGY